MYFAEHLCMVASVMKNKDIPKPHKILRPVKFYYIH